jgi:uncharacterized protein (DUF2147 family)
VKWILLSLATLAWFGAAQAEIPTPAGLWTTFSDSTGKPEGLVLIEERNGEFVGTVVKIFSTTEPNPVCDQCEGELKNRPVVGMTILRGLRDLGGKYDGGTILDPDEGRTYRCSARLLDGGRKLELRGYVGISFFGRTQTWARWD